MDKAQVISKLREHKPELKAAGIAHVHLFGSTARDEATPTSDIDLLIDFAEPNTLTLLTLSRFQSELTDLLGQTVDISSADWLREHVRVRALREAVLAF